PATGKCASGPAGQSGAAVCGAGRARADCCVKATLCSCTFSRRVSVVTTLAEHLDAAVGASVRVGDDGRGLVHAACTRRGGSGPKGGRSPAAAPADSATGGHGTFDCNRSGVGPDVSSATTCHADAICRGGIIAACGIGDAPATQWDADDG